MNVFADVGDLPAKKIPAENHAPAPQKSSGHVVRKIAAVRHLCCTCHRRTKRPNDGNKTREDDGLAAIFLVELVSALQVAFAEDKRILAPIESLARLPTNPVANLVAHNRA